MRPVIYLFWLKSENYVEVMAHNGILLTEGVKPEMKKNNIVPYKIITNDCWTFYFSWGRISVSRNSEIGEMTIGVCAAPPSPGFYRIKKRGMNSACSYRAFSLVPPLRDRLLIFVAIPQIIFASIFSGRYTQNTLKGPGKMKLISITNQTADLRNGHSAIL